MIEPDELNKEIASTYENLYKETERWRPQLEMRDCPRIEEAENNSLVANFEEQEIMESIKACAGEKAPGPDGYSMDFFKHCWGIIKYDLVAAIQNFHEESFFEKSSNATLWL